jgi:hypothetical protein
MANDFSTDNSCIALWNFESGALGTDSKSTNTLTLVNTPTDDAVNYKQGSNSMVMVNASHQFGKLSSPSVDFPLQTGDTNKLMSICGWFYFNAFSGYRSIVGKCSYASIGRQGFSLGLNTGGLLIHWGGQSDISTGITLVTGRWYHFGIAVDGVNMTARFIIWDDTASTYVLNTYYNLTDQLVVGAHEFRVGAYSDTDNNYTSSMNADEVVVFNRLINPLEITKIRSGTYSGTASWNGWFVDTKDGLDTGDGIAWATAWKTIKKTFMPGDVINILKSPETAAPGTVTATNGSVTVTTTNDLSALCPQYRIIRISNDDTLYQVRAINSTTITLYRPYRGTTNSNKNLTYFVGYPTMAAEDFHPTSIVGTSENRITIRSGINSSNNEQDGFTICYGNNASYLYRGSYNFVDISRIVLVYWAYSHYNNFYDTTFTKCLYFLNGSFTLGGGFYRCTLTDIVSENGKFFGSNVLIDVVINNIETSQTNDSGLYIYGYNKNVTINNWKNTGYASYKALEINGTCINLRFINPIFDELNSNCINISTGTGWPTVDATIVNPMIGSGTLYSPYSSSYFFTGKIRLVNVNKIPTDQRTYIGTFENNKYNILSSDNSIYNSPSSSAKITLSASSYPETIVHKIPCIAGVEKTISVYFRKNSSYGSITLPIMRLYWFTGLSGSLVLNTHDSTMTDVNDTFTQVSHTLTSSITGTIRMELIFKSLNAGAIVWYDDIGVV